MTAKNLTLRWRGRVDSACAKRETRRGGVTVHPWPIRPVLLAAHPTPALRADPSASFARRCPLQGRVSKRCRNAFFKCDSPAPQGGGRVLRFLAKGAIESPTLFSKLHSGRQPAKPPAAISPRPPPLDDRSARQQNPAPARQGLRRIPACPACGTSMRPRMPAGPD
jgi:hypothetical protein